MNRIKVLKDIIHDHDPDYTAEASESDLDSFAREINQLYESQPDVCPKCKGSKKEDEHFDHHYSNRCSKCNGTGKVEPQPDHAEYKRGFQDGQDVLKESGDRDKEPQPDRSRIAHV